MFSIFNRSLAARLLATIAAWTILALLVTGLLLTTYFRQNAERNFEKLLLAHAYNLMGAIDVSASGEVKGRPNLGDPGFLTPLSGWSWAVSTAEKPQIPIIFSSSMAGERVAVPSNDQVPFNDRFQRFYEFSNGDIQEKRVEAQLFLGESGTLYQIMVTGNRADIDAATAKFSRQIALFFVLFGLTSIIVAFIAVRLGLRPLTAAKHELYSVREGEKDTLDGNYPAEISPMISEINALIGSNREATERARVQVGNLAHALKTPLAVIRNETSGKKVAPSEIISEQADTMQSQIETYLNRARISAQVGTLNAKCVLQPTVERLLRVMEKLSASLTFEASIESDLILALEQQDLEEILGNLLENASHYAASRVLVSASAHPAVKGQRPTANLTIEDDGAGVDPTEFDRILERGKRLDETVPGTGLGLSIVRDIVEEYGGKLDLARSSLGGLKVAIVLPRLRNKPIAS